MIIYHNYHRFLVQIMLTLKTTMIKNLTEKKNMKKKTKMILQVKNLQKRKGKEEREEKVVQAIAVLEVPLQKEAERVKRRQRKQNQNYWIQKSLLFQLFQRILQKLTKEKLLKKRIKKIMECRLYEFMKKPFHQQYLMKKKDEDIFIMGE